MNASTRLRALFVNEGTLGAGVMGHAPVEAALRTGLATLHGVDARFRDLGAMNTAERWLSRSIPLLGALDLDLQPTRWHLAQSLKARRVVRAELRQDVPDVLHVNSHSIALLLAREMRRMPSFLSLDTTVWEWQRMSVWRPVRSHSRALLSASVVLERRVLTEAAAVLAWTNWAADCAKQACPRANVLVLPPGIDIERFRPAPRRPRTRPRVLFVGGRFAEKGGFDLLDALGPLLGRNLDLDLVTPASVPTLDGVRVHRLEGGSDQLIELYQQADVLCLPTHGDTLGWVLVEAMASGTPVIATPVGGIPDVLGGGRYGVLVPERDPPRLRHAVEELLADEPRRWELSERARTMCEERFDARRQTARLVELMRNAVHR